MIADQDVLDHIRESWKTVRTVDAMIQTNMNAGIFSLVPAATGFAKIPESLLLLFAVSVLEETLRQLRDEGVFSSPRSELKRLMEASRKSLPWQDYDNVDKVRDRRNRVAHKRELLSPGQCVADLSVVARELIAWGILTGDDKVVYTVTFAPRA